jgi:hypothetical protein
MMADTRDARHTGGCQCGAVRYALYADPTGASICHCRMCQKAFGNYFAPLAGVPPKDFAWTRGKPGAFKSSEAAERGFCRDCGTPLMYRFLDHDRISVSLGSLDDPSRVKPTEQDGIEGRIAWVDEILKLPGTTTESGNPPEVMARLASRQHPDHET